MSVSTAIKEASHTLTPLEKNIDAAGPGGQSYDLAPTPPLDDAGRDAPRKGPNTASPKKSTLAFVAISFLIGVLAGASLKRFLL